MVTAGGNAAIAVLGAVGGILAARLLGPEGRGELAAAVVWAGILGTIAQWGLPQALTYFTARDTEAIGGIFKAMLLLYVVQSVTILALGWLLVALLLQRTQPAAVAAVRLYLFSIPLSIPITYMSTMAQGVKQFRVFSLLRLGASTGYVLALCLAALFGLHVVRDVLIVLLIIQSVTLVCSFAWFIVTIRPSGHFEWSWVRRLLGYGLKSYGGSLSWIANARIDQFAMSVFISLESLGHYAVAVSYAGVMFPLLSAFAMVLFPHVAGGSRETARRKIMLALRSGLLVSCAGAVILGGLSWVAVPLLFGADFTPAIVPAVILLGGTIFLGCNYVLSDGLRGMGHPWIPSVAEVVGLAVTLAALYLLLPRFGIWGAAWASVLSYGCTFVVLWVGVSRVLKQVSGSPDPLVF